MNIVFVHDNTTENQYTVLWRCKNLANAINRTGLHTASLLELSSFIANDENAQLLCSAADLIVIHRFGIDAVLKTALSWKDLKKKIVLDIDEAINLIDEEMDQYQFWNKGIVPPYSLSPGFPSIVIDPPPVQQLPWAMGHFDAITVSSDRLAGDWEAYGHVQVVQDYIDIDQYLSLRSQPKEEIWIGLGGSPLSARTFLESGMLAAVDEVCRLRPQVRIFIGNLPGDLIQRIDIPRDQKVVYSWLPPEDWLGHLPNLDIGLAPASGEFDFRRGMERVLEYLTVRIPWVGSNHLPYRDLKTYGTLVENTPEAWVEGILSNIDSLNYFKENAEGKPYLFAVSQDIDDNVGKILEVYESIIRK